MAYAMHYCVGLIGTIVGIKETKRFRMAPSMGITMVRLVENQFIMVSFRFGLKPQMGFD